MSLGLLAVPAYEFRGVSRTIQTCKAPHCAAGNLTEHDIASLLNAVFRTSQRRKGSDERGVMSAAAMLHSRRSKRGQSRPFPRA